MGRKSPEEIAEMQRLAWEGIYGFVLQANQEIYEDAVNSGRSLEIPQGVNEPVFSRPSTLPERYRPKIIVLTDPEYKDLINNYRRKQRILWRW